MTNERLGHLSHRREHLCIIPPLGIMAGMEPPREPVGKGQMRAATPGYLDNKDAQLKRLRRIEGQVRGLERMVDADTYCIDILTQVSAVTRALEAVALSLLDDHLHRCMTSAARDTSQSMDDTIAEASAAIARLVRS